MMAVVVIIVVVVVLVGNENDNDSSIAYLNRVPPVDNHSVKVVTDCEMNEDRIR